MELLGKVRDRSVRTSELLQNAASGGVRERGERGIETDFRILNHAVQYVAHGLAACKGRLSALRCRPPSPQTGPISPLPSLTHDECRHALVQNKPPGSREPGGHVAALSRCACDHFASGSGRSCSFTSFGTLPLPTPSSWNGVRLPELAHMPRPFQPPFGSSMRPSTSFAKKPIG